MTPIQHVPISDLKIGDVVILESSMGGRSPDAYQEMLVADVAEGQVRFIRPYAHIKPNPEYYPNMVKIVPTSKTFVTIGAEDFLAYVDHKGLFYTVIGNVNYWNV